MPRHTLFGAAAGLVAAVVALVGCSGSAGSGNGSTGVSGGGGGSTAPGVTATSILIGSHQPLTGPAAPGYSEISPASKAMFGYINAHGGVNGRKITYKYLDDAYNPTQTVNVVRQLVLQDNVFAIFNGLGTPTHEKVTDFLNQNKVPDLFVASGCKCWNDPQQHPYTFGWQPDYTIEGKVLGKQIADTLKGKKVGYFYQNDDFGRDGIAGLDQFIPKSAVVSRQSYTPGNTDVGPQVAALKQAGAQVVVLFTIPAYTALFQLNSLKLGYTPSLFVTSVGSDPITLSGLLQAFAKQGGASVNGNQLIQGITTVSYLPPTGDLNDPWVKLFRKVASDEHLGMPFDGNVEYGMAVAWDFAAAVKAAGKNLTREGLVKAVQGSGLKGAGLVPLTYSATDHAGFRGVQLGVIKGNTVVLQGSPQVTGDSGPVQNFTGRRPTPADAGILPASALPSS